MDYLVVVLVALPLLATLAVAFFYPPVRNRLGLNGLVRWLGGLTRPRAPQPKVLPPQYIVRNGQIDHTPTPPGVKRTPHLLTVFRDHAVSLEDGAGNFHGFVIGPGVRQLDVGIQPKIVIITRPRFKRLVVRNIQTKEGLQVDRVDFGILYAINADETGSEETPIARPKTEALYRAAYRVAFWEEGEEKARAVESWEVAVQEMAKNLLRQEVSSRLLENLYTREETASAYSTIENSATAKLQDIVSEWGVEVRRIQIDGIWMAEEHQQAVARWWEMRKRTEAEADRIRVLEEAKSDAWRRTALDIQQALSRDEPNQAMALRLIEFLKYLDTLVEMGHYTNPPGPAMPSPAQVERMLVEPKPIAPGPAPAPESKPDKPPKEETGALPPGTPIPDKPRQA